MRHYVYAAKEVLKRLVDEGMITGIQVYELYICSDSGLRPTFRWPYFRLHCRPCLGLSIQLVGPGLTFRLAFVRSGLHSRTAEVAHLSLWYDLTSEQTGREEGA
jgi:hypothetical protein